MNIDFIGKELSWLFNLGHLLLALEQQAFTLDMPLSLFPLYSPSAFATQNDELTKISKKVSIQVLSKYVS